MKIPFMAGSTLPMTWRRPHLEFTPGIELEEALAVGSSDLEDVEGPEVWALAEKGEWSRALLTLATTCSPRRKRAAPRSSCFYIQLYNHNHWSFRARAFDTGITLFGLESRLQGQKWLDTP
jgi:hypothetical protein